MATKDNILRMGYLAQKLVRGDRCNLLMLGDSQFAPAVEPRIAQTMLRNWDVDWRERVYYGASSSAPSEGFQAFNFPSTSVDAGDSLPDGTTVPAGFDGALYRSYASNEFASLITRLRSSNLNNYYGGNWLEGQQIAWKLAVLGGVDPVPAVRVLGRDSAGTVAGAVTTNLGLTANSTWQQVAIETHEGTDQDAQEIFLDTANPNDETGQVFTYGAWSAGIANKVDGLQLSIVARGGDTVSDALPVAEGGSSTTESDLERVTKFNVMDAWPDVIMMNFGTNMETDEANDVAGVWRSRVEALIAWYRRLAAENGKASPYFVLMVPWETGSSQTRRIATQEAVRKIALSAGDVGVLDVYAEAREQFGPWADWQATYLADGTHLSQAGVDPFGQLIWNMMVVAGSETSTVHDTDPEPKRNRVYDASGRLDVNVTPLPSQPAKPSKPPTFTYDDPYNSMPNQPFFDG